VAAWHALWRLLAAAAVPLGVGVGVVVLLVWLTGTGATLHTLARLSVGEGAALVGAAFASSIFSALALRLILSRYGHAISTWLLFRLSILAFAVGWLVPSGYVAGFPVAAWLLRRRGVPFGRALAAFLIERFFEMAVYALVLPTVLMSAVPAGAALFAGVFAPLAALVLVGLDLGLGWRVGRRTLGFLSDRLPARITPALARGIGFLTTISAFFRTPVSGVLAAAAMSVLAIGASFGRAVLTVRFLNLPLGVPEVALLVAVSLLVVAIPFLPGAIGVYEGGMVGSFELLGRPASEGIAYALTVHGVELVVAVVGVVFLVELGVDMRTVREASAAAGR